MMEARRVRVVSGVAVIAVLGCLLGAPAHAESSGIVKGTVSLPAGLGALGDVVVYLEGTIGTATPAKAVIDQRDNTFTPRVVAVTKGSTVEFRNNDPVLHNVYSTSAPKHFDLGMFPKGESRTVTFDTPGVAQIKCNVHPKMQAFVLVVENSCFTTPDAHGNFQIGNIPAGRYKLRAWHPDLRPAETWVNLEEAKLRTVELRLQK